MRLALSVLGGGPFNLFIPHVASVRRAVKSPARVQARTVRLGVHWHQKLIPCLIFLAALALTMSRVQQYWLPGYGLSRHVVLGRIHEFLGPSATVRPFSYQVCPATTAP